MISYYSSNAMRKADRLAAEQLGIPGNVLMENAGRGAAEAIMRRYPEARNALILCGNGNNGGDGFVAARHLWIGGVVPTAIATRNVEEYRNEAAFAASAAKNSGINIVSSVETNDHEITRLVHNADVVVDALLGTGSHGAPRGEAERLIKLSSSHPHIVALDTPSGVDADTGEVGETAIKAELTVTFLAAKPGLVIAPGSYYSGEVVVTGIGVPVDVLE
ncbi:MAG: NAD(P)H-hydrate epimerase, partial [Synergistaceae bacterium]|nr:NAD(P)H-hydrate epimerase [Synergistaceae bacterium]